MSDKDNGVELVEKKEDIKIPETLEKYRKKIEALEDKYSHMIKGFLEGFDGNDLMNLIGTISTTISEIKDVVDDMKEVDGDDRVAIYSTLIMLTVTKSVEKSNLPEDKKQEVLNAFKSGSLAMNIIEFLRQSYKKVLKKMDTNKDNYVDKQEFKAHVTKSYKKNYPCVEEEVNEKNAECFANCCFPILACGKKKIKIDNN